MARVGYAVSRALATGGVSSFECHLALVPKDDAAAGRWSIDEEPIGQTWHDSSWMLLKGLDVIEEFDPAPPSWAGTPRWRDVPPADLGWPVLCLSELRSTP